jgi:hypothetical protein
VVIGAKCGSTTIDRQLHLLMSENYGEEFKEKGDLIAIGSKFMNHFEQIKRNFDGENKLSGFRLPLLMRYDLDDRRKALQSVKITR